MKTKTPRLLPLALAVCLFWGLFPFQAFGRGDGCLTNRIQILYDRERGLPTNEANVVIQTRDGYIWIGSYGGLIRYDGMNFRNFSLEENGPSSSSIRALFEDNDGRLWVGTNDRGVFVLEDGRFRPCVSNDTELYQSIRCFAQDMDGTIYVGTSTGLVTVDEGRMIPVENERLENQTIYSLAFDDNGALWGTAGAGFAFCLKDSSVVYWFGPGALSLYENYSVLSHGNKVYIGTNANKLLCLTFHDSEYGYESYMARSIDTGNISTINALFWSVQGELWLGGDTGYGWLDQDMELHSLRAPEPAAFINSIIQDYEGNIWLASTKEGVYKIASGKFQNANNKAGLEGQSVNSVINAGGLTYAASDNGLFIMDQNWNPVKNNLTGRLHGTRIRHLLLDSRGDVWISTYGPLGLIRYTPSTGETISISEGDGLLSNKVRKVVELADGAYAAATAGGVNILRGTKVTESYGQDQGLINPMILDLLELPDGTLLAGSDGQGIYVIRGSKVANINRDNGLTSGVVLRLQADNQADGIWISAGDSLYFMDQQWNVRQITGFRKGTGSIFDIMVMGDHIWLMKSSGLIVAPRRELLENQEITVKEYGSDSGLTSSVSSNSWSFYKNGVLYLCTADGVFLLDMENPGSNRTPPKIAINESRVFPEGAASPYVVPGEGQLSLPADTQRLTIEFACLSFDLSACTVEYYLEGFDQNPVQVRADSTNLASYTNLRGGDYVFHLKAINGDGVESSQETILNIHKELHYYEYPIFWILLALACVLATIAASQMIMGVKTRRMKQRQQAYKAITDQALKTFANTIDAKDSYTNGHSVRVAACSLEIAHRMNLGEEEQERIYYSALLHDIGKIGIPDAILNKPGKLTEEEFAVMRRHTTIGSEILKDFTALPYIGEGALCHHERYNGSGYPSGLKGEEIPLAGRIICAADAYDAMATKRAYRDPMSRQYILSEFRTCGGNQFDPEIAAIMTALIEEGRV